MDEEKEVPLVWFRCDVKECGVCRAVRADGYNATLRILGTCKLCRTGFMRRVEVRREHV